MLFFFGRLIMKSHTNTYTRRTSSADLVVSFGLSLVMHAILLLIDPLGHFNISNRLREQQSEILMVNLKDRVEPSQPAAAKKVSQGKREKNKKKAEKNRLPVLKSKAPRTPAKPVSPVHEPVHIAKAPTADSAPVLPIPAPVPPSDALPPKEAAPKAEPEIPVPAEKVVSEPAPPPVIVPDEQDITITDNLKPKPDKVKQVEKPLVEASSNVRNEEPAREEKVEQIPPPPVQEVHEPIKPEAPPPAPVVAAAAEPEESHAAPVKETPQNIPPIVKTEEVKAEAGLHVVHLAVRVGRKAAGSARCSARADAVRDVRTGDRGGGTGRVGVAEDDLSRRDATVRHGVTGLQMAVAVDRCQPRVGSDDGFRDSRRNADLRGRDRRLGGKFLSWRSLAGV